MSDSAGRPAFDRVLKGGQVVLPGGAAPQSLNIGIREGRIAALFGPSDAFNAGETLDVSGLTVMPGVVDVHLHLGHGMDISRPRHPDDAAQETAAAATGGVTTFIPYLMSADPFEAIFDDVRDVTERGARIDFSYHFVISTEQQLAGVPRYIREHGAPSFKIFMNNRKNEGARLGLPDIDDGFLYRLCEAAAAHGGMVCPHPENIEIALVLRDRAMAADPEGRSGLKGWNATRPPFVEAEAIQRAAFVAKQADAPIYFVHTSSEEALKAALDARAAGGRVFIETCTSYLTHSNEWPGGDVGKINPPLRDPSDCAALWQGVLAGQIDTIATDHVHRHVSAKEGGIWKASPGTPGMETLLQVVLSEGHFKRGIPLETIAALLSEQPARIMGMGERKGRIATGCDADFAIVDLKGMTKVANANVKTSAGYTIYDGWELRSSVVHTLVRGEFAIRDGRVSDAGAGRGRYIHRKLPNAAR